MRMCGVSVSLGEFNAKGWRVNSLADTKLIIIPHSAKFHQKNILFDWLILNVLRLRSPLPKFRLIISLQLPKTKLNIHYSSFNIQSSLFTPFGYLSITNEAMPRFLGEKAIPIFITSRFSACHCNAYCFEFIWSKAF